MDKESRAEKIIEAGSELTGAAAGAVVGLILGGAEGSVLGAAAATPLRLGALEVAQRILSHRERVRIGAALTYTAEIYKTRVAAGERVRDDSFFSKTPHGRSAADEITEGVLLVAQKTWEEKKVRHIGYLLGNIAFAPQLDPLTANRFLSLANQLSWKQYVLLALVAENEATPLPEGDVIRRPQTQDWSGWSTYDELQELTVELYLIRGEARKTPRHGFDIVNSELPNLRLASGGNMLSALLGLHLISEEDRSLIRNSLIG